MRIVAHVANVFTRLSFSCAGLPIRTTDIGTAVTLEGADSSWAWRLAAALFPDDLNKKIGRLQHLGARKTT